MNDKKPQYDDSCSLLDCCAFSVYTIIMFAINVCPIIGQIRGLYILCNPEKYLCHPDNAQRKKSHVTLLLNGYIILYVIGYGIYWIINNFHSENKVKKHIAQAIGTLIIPKIMYEMFITGNKWLYEDTNSSYFKMFIGHIFLTISTMGLFIIYRIFELYFSMWAYGHSVLYKKHHSGSCCGKEYNITNPTITQKIWAHICLTIVTFGIFIPIRLCHFWKYMYKYGLKTLDLNERTRTQTFLAHTALAVSTFGLYIIYKIFKLYFDSINYGTKKLYPTSNKEQITFYFFNSKCTTIDYIQPNIGDYLIGHLVLLLVSCGIHTILYIYFRCIVLSSNIIYESNHNICTKLFCRLLLIIWTLGIYIFWCINDFYSDIANNISYPPYSKNYNRALMELSLMTLGIPKLWIMSYSLNKYIRYISYILFTLLNAGFVLLIILLVKYFTNENPLVKALIIILTILSYPVMLFVIHQRYNEKAIYVRSVIFSWLISLWYYFKHVCDVFYNKARNFGIMISNRYKIISASIRTSASRTYANLNNRTMRILFGERPLTCDDPNYKNPIVYTPNISTYRTIKTYSEKNIDKKNDPKTMQNNALTNTMYCIDCVIGKLYCVYYSQLNMCGSYKQQLFADRFDNLPNKHMDLVNGLTVKDVIDLYILQIYYLNEVISIIPNTSMTKEEYDKCESHFRTYVMSVKNLCKTIKNNPTNIQNILASMNSYRTNNTTEVISSDV